MTFYFDTKHAELAAIDKTAGTAAENIETVEEDVVRDVSICSTLPGFPEDLAVAIDTAILRHGVGTLPINTPRDQHPDFETAYQHASRIDRLLFDLHSVFHVLADRQIEGFSDDPRAGLRVLFGRAEERREVRVAAELARAAALPAPEAPP